MFPLRDHNPSGQTPYITWALIAINVTIFLSYGFETNARVTAEIFFTWGLQPIEFQRGEDLHALFTTMFFHAGWMHLIGNMLFLWIFGDNMEDQMGHVGFLLFYLAGGFCATLAQIFSAPTSDIPLVGASGAIAAVMGGYLLLYPKAKVDILLILVVYFRVFTLPAWSVLSIWFALQVLNGTAADVSQGGVAYWAHAGGFVAGLFFTWPLWIKRGGVEFWTRTHMRPPHPETRYTKSSIPTVRRRR